MELQLSLALPTNYEPKSHCSNRKRCFDFDDDQDSQSRAVPRTLLLWNNQPDEDQDPPPSPRQSLCFSNGNYDEKDEVVVGWPPIKSSWRRKAINGGRRGRGGNSKYVKVKMEGVGIARKIDLSLYSSYQTLMDTLTRMFITYCGDNAMKGYKLVYQRSDGDWLLVEDEPSWRGFIQNVQRLKLARMIQSIGTGL